jgi:hypothetical protein
MSKKTILVIPDTHVAPKGCPEGGLDERAWGCAEKVIQLIKPTVAVHIGDIGEWHGISHWRYKRIGRPPIEHQLDDLNREADAVSAYLDDLDHLLEEVGCKEKHLIEGNHEVWVNTMLDANPPARKEYNVKALLSLPKRKWRYHPYGKYVKFGKLNMYHGGHYTSVNHARAHAINLGASVMYGHVHDHQVAKVQHLSGYHGAWSIGCLCKFNKPFLKGRPTNWSHNLAVVHLEKGGKFIVEMIDIVDGVAWVGGKRIKG